MADPLCHIGFMGNERTEALLKLASAVDRVFVFNRDAYRKLWEEDFWECLAKIQSLALEIRREKFDSVIDVSLGREFALGAWFAGIHRRVGFDYKKRGLFLNRKIKLAGYQESSVTNKQMELLPKAKLPHGSPQGRVSLKISPEASHEMQLFLEAFGLTPEDTIFAVAPGGGKSWGKNARYKQWDVDRFADATNHQLFLETKKSSY